jgi:hypothetical protein
MLAAFLLVQQILVLDLLDTHVWRIVSLCPEEYATSRTSQRRSHSVCLTCTTHQSIPSAGYACPRQPRWHSKLIARLKEHSHGVSVELGTAKATCGLALVEESSVKLRQKELKELKEVI